MGQTVNISTASVPSDYCPTSFAQAWPFGVSLLQAELSGDNFSFNFGSTTPTPDNQDKPWFRTNADGTPDRIYVYSNGKWISLHPTAPGICSLYFGSAASIDTLDGGEAGVVSATTGPIWQRKTICDAKFLVGVGTFPSTTAVAVTGTGGEEKHELIASEIPAHNHGLGSVVSQQAATKNIDIDFGGADDGHKQESTFGGDGSGNTVAHNNLPPYIGTFVIERTNRLYYRI